MSMRFLIPLFGLLTLALPATAFELEAWGGASHSTQGQSLAIPHQIQPRGALGYRDRIQEDTTWGIEVSSVLHASESYRQFTLLVPFGVELVSGPVFSLETRLGPGIATAPAIVFDGLSSDIYWMPTLHGSLISAWQLTPGFDLALRLVSEHLVTLSVDAGLQFTFD